MSTNLQTKQSASMPTAGANQSSSSAGQRVSTKTAQPTAQSQTPRATNTATFTRNLSSASTTISPENKLNAEMFWILAKQLRDLNLLTIRRVERTGQTVVVLSLR